MPVRLALFGFDRYLQRPFSRSFLRVSRSRRSCSGFRDLQELLPEAEVLWLSQSVGTVAKVDLTEILDDHLIGENSPSLPDPNSRRDECGGHE